MDPKEKTVPFTESTPPTQVRHPWKAVARTTLAVISGVALLVDPVLDAVANGDGESLGAWAVGALAVSGAVTRVLALPAVNAFLDRFVPFLAAGDGRHEA